MIMSWNHDSDIILTNLGSRSDSSYHNKNKHV